MIACVFDLDGTILDTGVFCHECHVFESVVKRAAEGLAFEAAKEVCAVHGKELTREVASSMLGRRPLECWQGLVEALDLRACPHTLHDTAQELLEARWPTSQLLPGAGRLLKHLHACQVQLAVATSTPRTSYDIKMSRHADLSSLFSVVICGDEVEHGKPAPDVFLAAARKLGIIASEILVFEDAPSGVEAALLAGMQVVAVPSHTSKAAYPQNTKCLYLKSLLDFNPTSVGFPAFTDVIRNVVPMDRCWRLRSPVVKGFGRGSRELGIPTANLRPEAVEHIIGEAVTGIYCGWASLGSSRDVYMMVMSVGYNPFYGNEIKTFEPWLLSEFKEDFYGVELRLVVAAYIRSESDFTTLEALKSQILNDADVARHALQHPCLARLNADPFLAPTEIT